MAYTQADLTAIETAIAGKVLRVEFQGQVTQYRSMGELMTARNFISDQLAAATRTAATGTPRATYYPKCIGMRD